MKLVKLFAESVGRTSLLVYIRVAEPFFGRGLLLSILRINCMVVKKYLNDSILATTVLRVARSLTVWPPRR
jgi:hypothetical protein